jgi:hypothetical protein
MVPMAWLEVASVRESVVEWPQAVALPVLALLAAALPALALRFHPLSHPPSLALSRRLVPEC